jgi:hypothetical protein
VNQAQDERLINNERMLGALRDGKDTVRLLDGGTTKSFPVAVVRDLNAVKQQLARIEQLLVGMAQRDG